MKEKMNSYLAEIKKIINAISLEGFEQSCIEFNSKELLCSQSNRIEINKTPLQQKINELFTKDKEFPFIYWFEFKSKNSKDEILNEIKDYSKLMYNERKQGREKSELKYYKTPAIKKTTYDSNILYVGKVNRDFIGRLQPHLGYYITSPNTSGLQLCHWAVKLDLNITINYIKLPKELVGFTGLLERKLANEIKPIIGKHRS